MKLKNAFITSIALLALGFMAISRHNAEITPNRVSRALVEQSSNTIKDTDGNDINSVDTKKKAQSIARAVTELEGVKGASVIITGNSAIVGIETTQNFDSAQLIELKKKAGESARAAHNSLEHVAVTAGVDLIKQIEKIADFSIRQDE